MTLEERHAELVQLSKEIREMRRTYMERREALARECDHEGYVVMYEGVRGLVFPQRQRNRLCLMCGLDEWSQNEEGVSLRRVAKPLDKVAPVVQVGFDQIMALRAQYPQVQLSMVTIQTEERGGND